MSGHSKWATTKRQKAITDAKRSANFTKAANLITIAARKGGDPSTNFSLRITIDKAKQLNLPKENIERAIKRGTGELAGAQIEELIYEGFGPTKSQFVVKCLTDNKNRTAAAIRHLFAEHGGSLGSVIWNFGQKGVIRITGEEAKSKNLPDIELELIDIGAQDIQEENEGLVIYTKPEDLQKVKQYLETKNIKTELADIEYVAKDDLDLTDEDKTKVEEFIASLDDNEDVSDYYTNVNL